MGHQGLEVSQTKSKRIEERDRTTLYVYNRNKDLSSSRGLDDKEKTVPDDSSVINPKFYKTRFRTILVDASFFYS